VRLLQCANEFLAKQRIFALDPAGSADKDMIGAGHAERGYMVPRQGAQTALQSIANDGTADLLGDGKADAHGRIAVIATTELKDESGHGNTLAAIGGEEICPFRKRD
jgi:hypothetical protein